MKTIWIEGPETAGLIHTLSNGFKDKGYNVITFADKNPFYDYKYNLNQNSFIADLISNRLINYPKVTNAVIILINKFFPNKRKKFLKKIQLKILRKVDFYIPIYSTFFINEKDFESIVKYKTKIIGYFLGSEIRIYSVFCKQFNVPTEAFKDYLNEESFENKLKKIRIFERFAHCIFSVPDQMSMAAQPYFHLQLPFDVSKFIFKINSREIPIILHCPSNSNAKGSDIIVKVVNELKKEGYKFEFKYIKNIQHNDLLNELSNADILLDELFANGPGLLSFEAMASGCVSLTRYFNESPECFQPPVISVDSNNLKDKLKDVLLNKEKTTELIIKGREYLLLNNTLKKVIHDMCIKMEMNKNELATLKYDYLPDFNLTYNNYLTPEQKTIVDKITF
ncbi:MAG: glycosyltransferase [Bacteroidetes bacterium]|nr:glycosyltransferase [Bacteroidota bacterium]